MSNSYYIFNNPGLQVGYITSQFAQGARLAGFEVSTNVESLQADGRFCPPDLRAIGVTFQPQPRDSDVVIIDERRSLSALPDLGDGSFKYYNEVARHYRTAVIYGNDDVNYLAFPESLKTFLPHQVNGFTKNPHAHAVPWGFTLEGFELAAKQGGRPRKPKSVLMNFNPTNAQTVRESIYAAAEELLKSKFELDIRHQLGEEYASQLQESQFALAVGGSFHWPKSDYVYLRERMSEHKLRLDCFPGRSRTVGIVRWDSFRFWESMAFGCIPMQLDFDLYGFSLPIKPLRWVHYVPLDLSNIAVSLEQALDLFSTSEKSDYLANSAREWAFSNGHPSTLFGYVSANL
jgi:hypothetical protein